MKAVCFTRNGKPDMRLIHTDIGDTFESIVRHIKSEFADKNLDIAGIKDYEDANQWLRFCLEMDKAAKTQKIAVLKVALADRRKQCENCETGKWGCGHCAEPKWDMENEIAHLEKEVAE
jgi:hypothetical protein